MKSLVAEIEGQALLIKVPKSATGHVHELVISLYLICSILT